MYVCTIFTFALAITQFWSANALESVYNFFPNINNDLTRIKWLHATNDMKTLKRGLEENEVYMIEGDVAMGSTHEEKGPIPIMTHPPKNVSDLSLEKLLNTIIKAQENTDMGVALDFKSDEAYNSAWKIINKVKSKLKFPVWLYADVLEGPGNPTTTPLNGENFIRKARRNLPGAPIALGWTNTPEGKTYSDKMLKNMLDLVKKTNFKGRFHLLVKADIAANSKDGILKLMKDIDKFQGKSQTRLSIWMSQSKEKKAVDQKKLKELISAVGNDKVAIDVPQNLLNEILPQKRGKNMSLRNVINMMINSWE